MIDAVAQHILPQAPRAPEVSLLTSAESFPEADQPYAKWRSGVSSQTLLCLEASSEAAECVVGDDDERYDPAAPDNSTFYPLNTYLPYGCEGFIGEYDTWDSQADAALKAKIAFHVARELWTGEKSGSPSLQSSAILLTTDGPLSPSAGAMMALAAYEECTQGAQAFILAPSAAQDDLESRSFYRRVGSKFVTTKGHIVVPGPGFPQSPGAWGPTHYTDNGDIVEGDPAEAAAGEAFLYVCGPIQAAGPVDSSQQSSQASRRHPRTNKYLTVPSVATIARFDPCCVFAVKIRITDAPQ